MSFGMSLALPVWVSSRTFAVEGRMPRSKNNRLHAWSDKSCRRAPDTRSASSSSRMDCRISSRVMVVAQKQNVSIITEYVLFDTLLVCLLFFYYLR
ncbi:hypothetical protein X976_5422 [Burkholderia pseudomallei MSHR7500]|nr:hypothetical protein X976_5422 [Burkholderia pseudomallei MSHR7500]